MKWLCKIEPRTNSERPVLRTQTIFFGSINQITFHGIPNKSYVYFPMTHGYSICLLCNYWKLPTAPVHLLCLCWPFTQKTWPFSWIALRQNVCHWLIMFVFRKCLDYLSKVLLVDDVHFCIAQFTSFLFVFFSLVHSMEKVNYEMSLTNVKALYILYAMVYIFVLL